MIKKTLISISIILSVLFLLSIYGVSKLFEPVRHSMNPKLFKHQSLPQPPSLEAAVNTEKQPNFVIILADDLGYGDIGVNGSLAIKTPNIDELAQQGINFTSGYSSAPICTPSRAGLLTGRYPFRSGFVQPMGAANDSFLREASRKAMTFVSNLGGVDNIGGPNLNKFLPLDEYTIAEMLQENGYATAGFGKWHLGDFSANADFHPKHYGFDRFVGFNMSNDDWPVALFDDEDKLIDDIGLEQSRYTKLFTDEAIDFIEQNKEQPFFVFLSQKDPHQPFFPSEQFKGKSEGGPYGDAVSEFDWNVGRVVDVLKKHNLDDNTLVIVTSDNGPWYEGSTGALRGRKGQSYEGGFRVPTVMWGKGINGSARTEQTPMMQIDLLPTFAELAGAALPTDRIIDGVSLVGLLNNEDHDLDQRPLFFFHDYDVEAVRQGKWKYIDKNSHYVWPVPLDKPDTYVGKALALRNYSPPESDVVVATLGTWPLLYNLTLDDGEAYNVAEKYPQISADLATKIAKFEQNLDTNPRGTIQ